METQRTTHRRGPHPLTQQPPRPLCELCTRPAKPKAYQKIKKPHCEGCGFVAVDRCQLDVDHINGDHKDDTPSNLQTLCANCYRLKTHRGR